MRINNNKRELNNSNSKSLYSRVRGPKLDTAKMPSNLFNKSKRFINHAHRSVLFGPQGSYFADIVLMASYVELWVASIC